MLDDLLQKHEALKEEQEKTEAFKLSTNYWPDQSPPVFALNGASLIWPGEFFSIAAKPGAGKSNSCEAIIAAWVIDYLRKTGVHIEADTLGFEAVVQRMEDGTPRRGMWYDFERTKRDAWQSWQRIYKRLGLHLARPDETPPKGKQYDDEGNIVGMDFFSCRHIKGVKPRLEEIDRLMDAERERSGSTYGFIMLDGGLRMVEDFNSLAECTELVDVLCEIAEKYDTTIGLTLHVNPNTEKVTGHLGSVVNRYCRANLLIKPHEQDKDVRVITSDFGMGKMSFAGGGDCAFKWDDDLGYMVSCDMPDIKKPEKFPPDYFIATFDKLSALGKTGWVNSADVKQAYMDITRFSDDTAKRAITKASRAPYNYLEKSGTTKDSLIRLSISAPPNKP